MFFYFAGLIVGLWWGERTRRIDAQRAAGTYRPRVRPATTTDAGLQTTGVDQMFTQSDRDRMIQDTMAEVGCSREEAELDVDRMLALGTSDGFQT